MEVALPRELIELGVHPDDHRHEFDLLEKIDDPGKRREAMRRLFAHLRRSAIDRLPDAEPDSARGLPAYSVPAEAKPAEAHDTATERYLAFVGASKMAEQLSMEQRERAERIIRRGRAAG